ncbi:MAG TPA: O-antigen ligase family protein, partial [Tepidisphaeraceae bacterium]|nr:O-antigen ligase family protein [Tepidisphaeraceae bacterium]
MTDPGRHLHPSPLSAPPPEDDAPPWGVWLSRLALLIGLAVVVARVTSVEMLREPFEVQPAGQSAPRGAGPATGVVLDLLAAVPALLVLLRRALDRSFALRFTWAFVPMALLAAWTVLSSTWAGDRFAAAVGASHWAAALALLWAAAQLVTTGRRARLVAGACLGLLTVLSVHGLTYRWQELPELRRGFQEQKAAFFRERGWEPGSFAARQYEQKVMNGEMIGFSASANTFAALLVVTMVVAAGLGVERARDGAGVPLAVAVVVGVGFWVNCYTNSRAALATPVLAAAAFAACGVAGRHLRRFGTPLYLAGVLAFAAVVLFLVQHGARTGTLFHDSLNFRWRYWVGGWRVLLDRPLLGVGWDNFGANYLAKRLPIASEEVRDPHNLLVRAFAELGVIGGGLMLAWLLLLAWRVTRPKPDAPLPQVAAPPGLPHDEPTPIRVLAAPVAIAVCGIGLSAIASIDFAQAADYVSLELMKRGLFALLMLGGLAVAA